MVQRQLDAFEGTRFLRLVNEGRAHMRDYHTVLATLFHQTYSGPYTFALAAVRCPWQHEAAKEYLLRHAEEERTHWRWVLQDLAATGYTGQSPRDMFPHPTCQAYISLNLYVAENMPVARLAIAAVLEGIGARHGAGYGRRLLDAVGISATQASFFLSHGETDKTHSLELGQVIQECELSSEEWRWMVYAAECAGRFYRAMYDHEGYSV
jgi:hypothetical protein